MSLEKHVVRDLHTTTLINGEIYEQPAISEECEIKGYYTPNQKVACFVLYRKIISTLLKNNICNLL